MGNEVAREGLNRLLDESLWTERLDTLEANWKVISERYRMVLYDHGEEREGDEFTGRGAKPGFSRDEVENSHRKAGNVVSRGDSAMSSSLFL